MESKWIQLICNVTVQTSLHGTPTGMAAAGWPLTDLSEPLRCIRCHGNQFCERGGMPDQYLMIFGQVVPVCRDQFVHHFFDGINIQFTAGMGIEHGGLVNVLAL